jgi:hypothetical protein
MWKLDSGLMIGVRVLIEVELESYIVRVLVLFDVYMYSNPFVI